MLVLVLIDTLYLHNAILLDLFSMQKEAADLSKQSDGLTRKFVDDWNTRWAEEVKRKEKLGEGVNFVFRMQKGGRKKR